MPKLDLSFQVVGSSVDNGIDYSAGCTSGGSSGCCTAICSGGCKSVGQEASMAAWEQYLEINAGVLQY